MVDISDEALPQKLESNRFEIWFCVIREVLAILFLIYSFTQLFVFNIDSFIASKLGSQFYWLPKYKFLLFFGLLAVIWALGGTKRFFKTLAYVLFYLFILLFWKIPKILFKELISKLPGQSAIFRLFSPQSVLVR